jgi:NAD(P)H-dependent flavin oxidoreductase YrpB (nitropropane dioxygenase family)
MRKELRTVLGIAVLMGGAFVATPEASAAAEGKRNLAKYEEACSS